MKRRGKILFNSGLHVKKLLAAFAFFLILFLVSCSGLPKYTYEEYKKLKAFGESKSGQHETLSSGKTDMEDIDEDIKQQIQSYYDDVNYYNSYISEFRNIYNKYSALLLPAIDGFDSEQFDIDKKNDYARLIKLHMNDWARELEKLYIPGIVGNYHEYIMQYLDNEILFYSNFLDGDAESAEKHQEEANKAYNNSTLELQDIEAELEKRAQMLQLE